MLKDLSFYLQQFTNLRVNKSASRGDAPHKPIMLLSVIQAYRLNWFQQNRITLSPDLIRLFRTIWSQLVVTDHRPTFVYPFFHLSSSAFWRLIPQEVGDTRIQKDYWMCKSVETCSRILDYVEIDRELSAFLQNEQPRKLLETAILNYYFPDTMVLYKQVMAELFDQDDVQPFIEIPGSNVDTAILDENLYIIRGGTFKKIIPQIYNNTCAISKSRFVSVQASMSMIDACHIIPFSETRDDSVNNGIALCPNLHRAFDRGLLSVSDDYTVLISRSLVEDSSSPYNLSQFEGQKIFLPFNEQLYPSLENFAWHRKHFGF